MDRQTCIKKNRTEIYPTFSTHIPIIKGEAGEVITTQPSIDFARVGF